MLAVYTFLTTLYMMADDFCQSRTPKNDIRARSVSLRERGDHPIHLRSVVQVCQREGLLPLRPDQPAICFATLPDRSQFNRCARLHIELIETLVLYQAALLQTPKCPYESTVQLGYR